MQLALAVSIASAGAVFGLVWDLFIYRRRSS